MHYRTELDGLRAVALVPVIFFHAGFDVVGGGFLGVDVFFVISGYLITSIILSEMDDGVFRLINFYERRARRILPALFFVMALCVPLAWLLLMPRDMKDFAQSLLATATFSSNILFWHETDYFGRGVELKPLVHTWSLAVEEQYYILFPLFLMVTWRLGKQRIIIALSIMFLMSLGISHWAAYNSPSAAFYLLPTRGWEILVGASAAFWLNKSDRKIVMGGAGNPLSLLGLGLIAFAVFVFDKTTPLPGLYSLVPTIGTLLIIVFAQQDTYVAKILSIRPIVGLGLISYSAYLWHQPLFALVRHHNLIEPSGLQMMYLSLATVPLAYLSWRFIEQPFRHKSLISRKRVFISAISMTAVFVCFGIYGHVKNGFEDSYVLRFDEKLRPAIRQFSSSYLYVDRRWDSIGSRNFSQSGSKIRVLVIGDSFGRDLINAIYESGLDDDYDISVYSVPAKCGHIFSKADLSPVDIGGVRPECDTRAYYGDQKLFGLMRDADEVWLVASWSKQVAEMLPASIETIQSITDATLLVWGRKYFGKDVSLKTYLHALDSGNEHFVAPLPVWHVSTNNMMKNTLSRSMFVDISRLMCKSDTICRNTTTKGGVISFDGVHLTKEGAMLLGAEIRSVLLTK